MANDVSWVRQRGGCTTAGVLANIHRRLGEDVEKINSLLPPVSRQNRTFKVTEILDSGGFNVHLSSNGKEPTLLASFCPHGDVINVRVRGDEQDRSFIVEHKWITEDCKIFMAGKGVEIWKISREILEPVVFDR